MKPGDAVTWLHEPRGGYGYTFRVPATVVRITATRIVIDTRTAIGGWRRVTVRPDRLSKVKP